MSTEKEKNFKIREAIYIVRSNYFRNNIDKMVSKKIIETLSDPSFSVDKDADFSFIIPLEYIRKGTEEYNFPTDILFEEMLRNEYNSSLESYLFSISIFEKMSEDEQYVSSWSLFRLNVPSEGSSLILEISISIKEIIRIRNNIEKHFGQEIRDEISKAIHHPGWVSFIRKELIAKRDLLISDFIKERDRYISTDIDIIGSGTMDDLHPKFFIRILSEVIKTQFPVHSLAKFLL